MLHYLLYGECMSDRIEQIREEPPFICVSVKQVIHDRRQGETYEFGKKKKGKKDEKAQDRQSASAVRESTVDMQGTEHGGCEKISAEENQCGNIIDIEA